MYSTQLSMSNYTSIPFANLTLDDHTDTQSIINDTALGARFPNQVARISAIPLLIDKFGREELENLRVRIRTDTVDTNTKAGYLVVFKLTSIQPAQYVRTIQEIEMLKTKVMGVEMTKQRDGTIKKTKVLSSFHDTWNEKAQLRQIIMDSRDPHEEIWKAMQSFGYKLATNFMPMYARSIFEFFHATSVLDPCAGWGDRMAGALSSRTVTKYVGVDPNINLRPGYKKIMNDFGEPVAHEDETSITFSSGHTIHSKCFEECEDLLRGCVFDFAFTGPPFFLYEDYGAFMPRYKNWLEDFYKPLFTITHNHLKSNGFFAVYLNDSLGGKIEDYMVKEVPKFTSFKWVGNIGMIGGSSSKIRKVFIFQKGE